MSEQWIKFRKKLVNDGRVFIIAESCNVTSVTVVGALVTLWSLADDYAEESGLLYGYTAQRVNDILQIPGFCEALPGDWIDLSGDWVNLPKYSQHNGTTAKSRALTQNRVSKHRARNDATVTEALPEKRREEKIREEKRRLEKKVAPSGAHRRVKMHQHEIDKLISEDGLKPFLDRCSKIDDWCLAKGKTYKDYAAAYRNWRKRDAEQHNGNGHKQPQQFLNQAERTQEMLVNIIKQETGVGNDENRDGDTFEVPSGPLDEF